MKLWVSGLNEGCAVAKTEEIAHQQRRSQERGRKLLQSLFHATGSIVGWKARRETTVVVESEGTDAAGRKDPMNDRSKKHRGRDSACVCACACAFAWVESRKKRSKAKPRVCPQRVPKGQHNSPKQVDFFCSLQQPRVGQTLFRIERNFAAVSFKKLA